MKVINLNDVAIARQIVCFFVFKKKYEIENKIVCNYIPFCFVAKYDDIIIGAIIGEDFFAEIYVDEIHQLPIDYSI